MAVESGLTEFEAWRAADTPYLAKVKAIMSEAMPDGEEELIAHLRLIEAHYARIGCLLAEANGHLDRETDRFFADPEVLAQIKTVREREVAAEGKLSSVREMRDKIEAILRSIELRVHLGQSILRQQRGERRMAS